MSDVDAFLAHYGKLGMKWGRRGSGRANAPEHAQARSLKRNKAQHLTDAELKQVIGRIKLERQYRDVKTEPELLNRANKIAISILAVGTTINAAIAFANSPVGKSIVDGVKTAVTKGAK